MSILASCCHVVHSRDVSPPKFDGLAMSGLANSVAPRETVCITHRREFTTSGVAAGVSAGFNAPIGGLLFAMEDLSSFWTKTLSWQTFFCCVVAAIVAQVFNTAFIEFAFQKAFGDFNVQV